MVRQSFTLLQPTPLVVISRVIRLFPMGALDSRHVSTEAGEDQFLHLSFPQ